MAAILAVRLFLATTEGTIAASPHMESSPDARSQTAGA